MSTVKLFASLLALALLLPAGAAAKKKGDWPQFRFDAENTGYNKFEEVINKNNVGDLVEAYNYEGDVFLSSSVTQGLVYTCGSDSWGSYITARDASTGERLWNYPNGYITYGFVISAPAVANGVVYAVESHCGFYALDAASGEELWIRGVSHLEIIFAGESYFTPVVANGVIYVGSDDSKLYAFDAATGDLLWSYDSERWSEISSPAVAKGVVYMSVGGELHALDAASGNLLWKYEGVGSSHPVVAHEIVFVGSGFSGLIALEAASGDLLWTYTGEGSMSSPAVAKGVVYTSDSSGKIIALRAATGQVLWSTDTGASAYFSSPTVANGVVYVGSSSQTDNSYTTYYAFDAASGDPLWENRVDGVWFARELKEYYSPVVVNGMVYTRRSAYKLGGVEKAGKSKPAVKAK